MPILFSDDYAAVDPTDLTTFVRSVPTETTIALLDEFPVETSEDNTVSWAEITRTNRTARYRAFDGGVHVSDRDGGKIKSVPMLPLSTQLTTGELEALQLQFAKFRGTREDVIARAAYDDAANLTREVQARLEQAWGDTLTDGTLTINENGIRNAEIDYDVPANHKVTAATAWTNPAAAVLTQLTAMNDTYRATNGVGAGQMKSSRKVINAVRTNPEVIAAIHGATADYSRVSLAALNELLADEGLPTFAQAYDSKVDVDGVEKRVIDENRLLMMPADLGELGKTYYGVTATAMELVKSESCDFAFEEAPGIVGVVFQSQGVPLRQFVYVDAVAMPVLTNARRLLTATVYPA